MSDDMEEIIADFITEAEESLDKIDPLFIELETKGQDKDILNNIFRSMHTIKGAAGFLGFQSVVDIAHSAESILKKLREDEISLTKPLMNVILKSADMLRFLLKHIKAKDGIQEDTTALLKELEEALKSAQEADTENPVVATSVADTVQYSDTTQQTAEEQNITQPLSDNDKSVPDRKEKESAQTLRVDIDRIDKVMDLTGEVVLVRNRLLNIINYLELKYSDDPYIERLIETVFFFDLVTSDIQIAVMRIRMQPIKKVFSKFPRFVRDISNNLGKDVELNISGEDTEVDRSVIEHIGDPLVHIIRNAIDHGLELREERRAKGKPEKGTITISAYQRGNQIVIEVSDNGKGVDLERVKKKALERALITEDEALRMTDEAIINLIFLPGFSTADVATELSGRGVGMDVVKTNISKLNGYVEVTTKKDIGTTFRISIPLTLAIIQALMVRAGGLQYAIPLAPIEETLKFFKSDITDVVGQKVLHIREMVHPVFELSNILGNEADVDPEYRYAVVVSIGDRQLCIAVDELLGQEEIVIKTIEGVDTDLSYVIGATITGEGKVVLILDLAAISRNVLGAIRA